MTDVIRTSKECHCRACVGDHAGHGPCTKPGMVCPTCGGHYFPDKGGSACALETPEQLTLKDMPALLLGILESATALHRADGSILAYQVYPKDMDLLLAELKRLTGGSLKASEQHAPRCVCTVCVQNRWLSESEEV